MTTLASIASPRGTITALAILAVACGTCGASPALDRLRDEDVGVSRAASHRRKLAPCRPD
jgi:hypothetical protein